MLEIRFISAADTLAIRLEELRKNIPLPVEFEGDLEEETIHLGAFYKNNLVAISSYMMANTNSFEGKQFQLRGMATLKEYQGMGAGKLMLKKVIELLQERKVDVLWCNARVVAVPFYQKQGFSIYGNSFDINYVGEHYKMYINIKY